MLTCSSQLICNVSIGPLWALGGNHQNSVCCCRTRAEARMLCLSGIVTYRLDVITTYTGRRLAVITAPKVPRLPRHIPSTVTHSACAHSSLVGIPPHTSLPCARRCATDVMTSHAALPLHRTRGIHIRPTTAVQAVTGSVLGAMLYIQQ